MADISKIKALDGVTYNIKDPNAIRSVSDGNPTLAWGTKSKVATVGSTDIHVTMPSKPSAGVTSVATGAGLTGGTITGTGTVKANLKSETLSTLEAATKGSTADREYAVGLDKNGKLSVNVPWEAGGGGDANIVELTQAEYDALATKDPDVTYFITDGTVNYPTASEMRYDNSESGLSATNVQDAIDEVASYSTSETVVGKWIDGKPLYRKVFNVSPMPASSAVITTFTVEEVIRVDGIYISGGSRLPLIKPAAVNYAYESMWYVDGDKNLRFDYGSGLSIQSGLFIVEYTKTTD